MIWCYSTSVGRKESRELISHVLIIRKRNEVTKVIQFCKTIFLVFIQLSSITIHMNINDTFHNV